MKRSEVIPAVIAAVTAAASPAAVIRNTRTEANRKVIEAKLVTAGQGYVLEVDNIAGATVSDVIKRGAFSSTSVVIMRLRLNTQTAPAGITADTMLDDVDAIICALLNSRIGASIQGEFLDELPLDDGLTTYQITATIITETSS
jgi:hypothetical protein